MTYRTPTFSGLQFSAQYSFGTDTKKDYDANVNGVQFEEGSLHVDRFATVGATFKRDALNLALVLDTWDYGNTPMTKSDDDAFTVTGTGSYDFGVLRYFAGAQFFKNARTDAMKVFKTFDAAKAALYQDGYFDSEPSKSESAIGKQLLTKVRSLLLPPRGLNIRLVYYSP